MKKSYLILLLTALLGITSAEARPAYPGKRTVTLKDGRQVELTLRGDEHFSYFTDAEGHAYTLCEDVLTYGVKYDPAAEDSPFATYFAAPEGMVDLTLHFVDDGTEMKYTMPHGIYFIIAHGDQSVDTFLDEACTQPYEGGNQLDELTLYVK